MSTEAIPANCQAVTQSLLAESGRLGPGMFSRSARVRPIIRLQSKTRGQWMNGMGVTLGAVTFERSFAPLTGDPWETIAVSDGDSVNACLPPTDEVSFGQTNRTYTPKHYAVNTEYFCIRDIQFGWQFSEFLRNITRAFSTITEWVWARRYTQDYFTIAGHKLTLNKNEGILDSATVYNTTHLPTADLTQNVLNDVYTTLYREAADKPSGVDTDTNEPVFTLILSSEQSKRILEKNPQIRDDLRYAYMGKGEMSPLVPGMPTKRRNFGGFIHEIDPYPRRFVFYGGAYHEVAPFVASATTKGNKWELNPDYKVAPFEEAIVWLEDVYQDLAVNTITNPAPGWNFDARTWMGEFSPRNILERTCNPDGTQIFFRALFASAAKPLNPVVGYTIIYARCSDLELETCYQS